MKTETETLSNKEKLQALRRVAQYRTKTMAGLVILGSFVAFLEGIGLSFIYPIIETAQAEEPTNVSGAVMEAFVSTYQLLDIPFSLGYLIVGVALVMTTRYTMSFLVGWLASVLGKRYERDLRTRAFSQALDAQIEYYDKNGTDDILNAIITETRYSGRVIKSGISMSKTFFLVIIYISVMFYITPTMTLLAIVILGGITVILRFVIEPAVTVGTRVAEANERVQETVQMGTQGIRDIKLFGLRSEVYSNFSDAMDRYTRSEIDLSRNNIAIQNFFELSAALSIFVLIYTGFTFTGLSLSELGIFLIAMFQLAPKVSTLNTRVYKTEGLLSHAVRSQEFLDELDNRQEHSGELSVSASSTIEFDDVHFAYEENEPVLRGISFDVSKGEYIAFAGQSGAGKSTIVSLLTRMYDPDAGKIRADGVSIGEFDLAEWRERVAVVRQKPFIFTDSLENNVTIGNRDATRRDVERVCKIAKVDEFVDDLPNGYESQLGDDGVRLSGGQRQRVALARALLKDADFLVLDEATSDLDSNLEKKVQAAIESMNRDYGIIVIAHRLSTVKNADRIYTVDDGEIIESGTHQELLGINGAYAELYTIQSKS
jgi:subfamily B ATP-binding cassette protein MsbA